MTATGTTTTVVVPGTHLMAALVGPRDQHLRQIEEAFPSAEISVRGNEVSVRGEQSEKVGHLFEELVGLLEQGHQIDPNSLNRVMAMVSEDERPSEVLMHDVLRGAKGRQIRPKSTGQKRYIDAIENNVITFGIGPAGTGKSWLAVAMAVKALQAKQVQRIILTRPAVEAGERLGFLPGDLMAKIDPYLRPLYDALYDMVEPEGAQRLLERQTVEVAPLAFMRGRAQPVDRQVLTPTGWQAIGSLRVGDLVIGSDGYPTPVLGVFPQGERDVFAVRTQDGASTVCCGEHLWFVRTIDDARHRKPGRVVQTAEMIGRLRGHHQRVFELPLVSAPVQFETQPLPMDPYALGLLLGDGCLTTSTTPSFATADVELVTALNGALQGVTLRKTSTVDYVLQRTGGGRGRLTNPVTAVIRDLGLAGTYSSTKFVPPEYLFNSPDVRLAVLQGLLDSDGGPVRQQGRSCRISFTTCSPRLRDDVAFLVRSLGGVAYWRTRPAFGRRPGGAKGRPIHHRSDSYPMSIRLPAGLAPFRLTRKRRQYEADGGGRPMRFVDSIEPVGRADTVCIQVAAQDSLYVTDDFLVTHNTLNNSFIILDEAQNTTPEQMKMFLTRIGFGSRVVVTGDVTQVDVPTGTSGLLGLERVLQGIDGLAFVKLGAADVVRHRIVADIVAAYERTTALVEPERS